MKVDKLISMLSLIIAMMLLASGCGSDGGAGAPDEPDVQALLTTATWKVKSVTVDGLNKNDLFSGFTVTFTATGFTSSNGDPVWPSNGTWAFADATKKLVTRSDGTTVTLESISEDELILSLIWSKTTLGGGKINSIAGTHVFTLSR